MKFTLQHLGVISSFFIARIDLLNAIPLQTLDQDQSLEASEFDHSLSLSLPPRSPPDPIDPLTTGLVIYTSSQPKPRGTHGRLKKRLTGRPPDRPNLPATHVMGIVAFYQISHLHQMTSLQSGNPGAPHIQLFTAMYSKIRNAATNIWANSPEGSYVRVVFGKINFIIQAPAGNTVPWGAVEMIAADLLVALSAGLFGFVTGFYPVLIASTTVMFFLAVLAEPWPYE